MAVLPCHCQARAVYGHACTERHALCATGRKPRTQPRKVACFFKRGDRCLALYDACSPHSAVSRRLVTLKHTGEQHAPVNSACAANDARRRLQHDELRLGSDATSARCCKLRATLGGGASRQQRPCGWARMLRSWRGGELQSFKAAQRGRRRAREAPLRAHASPSTFVARAPSSVHLLARAPRRCAVAGRPAVGVGARGALARDKV